MEEEGEGKEECSDLTLIKTFLKVENFVGVAPICSLSRSLQTKRFIRVVAFRKNDF